MGTSTRTGAESVVRLRRARIDDVEAMLVIEDACFTDPWSRYALAASVQSPALAVTVAELGDQEGPRALVGYSVLAHAADEAELLNLAVADVARRRGVGAALVRQVLTDAAARNARAVFLEVRASNEPARRLYGSAGFEEVGRRKDYYRRPSEDALILRRGIAQ
jgi:[ribosomal protein S18]-alanine N-acetyltransferase